LFFSVLGIFSSLATSFTIFVFFVLFLVKHLSLGRCKSKRREEEKLPLHCFYQFFPGSKVWEHLGLNLVLDAPRPSTHGPSTVRPSCIDGEHTPRTGSCDLCRGASETHDGFATSDSATPGGQHGEIMRLLVASLGGHRCTE
jgi:hypothetical protein